MVAKYYKNNDLSDFIDIQGKYIEAEDALNKLGRDDDPSQFYKQVL